jgi:hypothetical protein
VQSRVCLTAPIFTSARACGHQGLARTPYQGTTHHTENLAGSLGLSCVRGASLEEMLGEDSLATSMPATPATEMQPELLVRWRLPFIFYGERLVNLTLFVRAQRVKPERSLSQAQSRVDGDLQVLALLTFSQQSCHQGPFDYRLFGQKSSLLRIWGDARNGQYSVNGIPIFRVPEYSELSVPADGRR